MLIRSHMIIGWLLVLVTLGLVGFWVPVADKVIGASYLIFFFHFPSAVNGLNLFVFAGILSLVYLLKEKGTLDLWAAAAGLRLGIKVSYEADKGALDLWAAAAVEVGLLATTITLATGSIWAKAAWGIWWAVNDPRLMSVAIMWLTYLGYAALRNTLEEPAKRARFCAVFGVLAALNVPVVLFAIRVLGQKNHPMAVTMAETSMVVTRWFGAGAFFVLYTALWRLRHAVLESADGGKRLEENFSRAGI